MTKNVELLSPAGNLKSFEAACLGGANAIYMGCENFNARVMAENFSIKEYKKCILNAHILNIKVYLTLNTLLFDNEIQNALNLVLELYQAGLDGVIVQDIGIAKKIHELLPDLPLHASTQMSVYSLEQVKFLEKLGFKRVVLARELSIEEIEYITKNTDLEIEVFVHGALCVSFSGQCLMSKMIGDRSANRGSCAQPCRKKYSIVDNYGKEVVSSKYLISKKDTYGLEYIKKLTEIGVKSLKIEGRNKTFGYVYLTTKIYRKYLDNLNDNVEEKDKKLLMQIFNRSGLCTNYLDSVKKEESISFNSPKNTGLYLGKVLDKKKHFVKVKLNENINMHDGIEIHKENNLPVSTIVTCIKDDKNNIVNDNITNNNYAWLGDINSKVDIGDKIYKTSSASLNNEIETLVNSRGYDKREVLVNVIIKENEKIRYYTTINNKEIEVLSENVVEKAISKSLTIDDIKENFSKNKDSLFKLEINKIELDNNVYVPVSVLNELRRNLLLKLEQAFVINNNIENIKLDNVLINNQEQKSNTKKINSLFIYNYDKNIDYKELYFKKFNKNLERLYINISVGYSNIKNISDIVKKYNDVEIILYISNVTLKKESKYIENNILEIINTGIKGFLFGSYQFYDLIIPYKEKYNLIFIADYSLNIVNSISAKVIKDLKFDMVCIPPETTSGDILDINNIIEVELLNNKITVMTTRYCVLSSFLRDKSKEKCSMPCVNGTYKLKDEKNYTYDIYTSNIDCISKFVRSINVNNNYQQNIIDNCSIRNVI